MDVRVNDIAFLTHVVYRIAEHAEGNLACSCVFSTLG
jgi:hypothetical protein